MDRRQNLRRTNWLDWVVLTATAGVLACAAMLWTAGAVRVVDPRHAAALFAATSVGGLLLFALAWLRRRHFRWLTAAGSLAALGSGLAFAFLLASDHNASVLLRPGPDSATASARRLRILQLNVLHGYPDLTKLDHRTTTLVEELRRLDPDVLILQEAWRFRGRRDLTAVLADELGLWAAYARANGSLRLLGFEEGSAILSRYPIASALRLDLAPRKHAFDRRIALRADLDLGDGHIETVIGVHLTPGNPEVTRAQADHLTRQLEKLQPLVVSGDLNQPVDSSTLARFLEAGYRPLVSDGVDHVLQPTSRDDWSLLWSEVALPTQDGLSDHPGLLVELTPRREPDPGRWRVDWQRPTPARLGFDSDGLQESAKRIGEFAGVSALIVLRHGQLGLERYFRSGRPERLHNMKSASKSVLSALTGIAIDEGHLDLDTQVIDLVGRQSEEAEASRRSITVRHLLTMSSGLESTSFGNYGRWVSSRNWVATALSRPMQSAPGESFRYSTGNTHLLSAVLTAATGRSALDFACEKLFGPLGIEHVRWERDPQGIYMGGNNLALTPRDMARFGQLYLDRGRWGETQVVPWRWVDSSTRSWATSSWRRGGYGYLWWMRPAEERGAYNASGHGGQYVYVSPAWDLVVVVNSSEASKGRQWRRDLVAEIRAGILGSLPAYPRHQRL